MDCDSTNSTNNNPTPPTGTWVFSRNRLTSPTGTIAAQLDHARATLRISDTTYDLTRSGSLMKFGMNATSRTDASRQLTIGQPGFTVSELECVTPEATYNFTRQRRLGAGRDRIVTIATATTPKSRDIGRVRTKGNGDVELTFNDPDAVPPVDVIALIVMTCDQIDGSGATTIRI